jgi:predicted dehydrogenase
VVGVGRFGRLHAETLTGIAEAELTALVDTDAGARTEAARRFPGVPVWSDLETALSEAEAEAWVVATRTPDHIPAAERILKAGGCALIEKPLAENLVAARRLEPLVTADSRNLMLGHILLFAADFHQLTREVRQRGLPVYFHLSRHRPLATRTDFPEETPLSLLMIHDLYLAYALMDGAEPARMTARLRRHPRGGYDLAWAELEWTNGTVGMLTASFLTPPGLGADGYDKIELFGEGWAAQLQLNPQPLQVATDRLEWPRPLNIETNPPSGWLAEELRCFCRVVRGQETVPFGARYADGLQIQGWLERLQTLAKGENHAG